MSSSKLVNSLAVSKSIFSTTYDDIHSSIINSDLCECLPSNIIQLIIDFFEWRYIYFSTHDDTDIRAFDMFGTCLGTIVSEISKNQRITAFEFDPNGDGSLYVAMCHGFVAKYEPANYFNAIHTLAKNAEFETNIRQLIRNWKTSHFDANNDNKNEFEINDFDDFFSNNMFPEGLSVMNNEKYQSIFITIGIVSDLQQPFYASILQISLDGKHLQRIIGNLDFNELRDPWSLKRIPKKFYSSQNQVLQNKDFLMVVDENLLKVIDIETGVQSNIVQLSANGRNCGDFCFVSVNVFNDSCISNDLCSHFRKPTGTRMILAINLQDGIIEFRDSQMFCLLKTINLNDFLDGNAIIHRSYSIAQSLLEKNCLVISDFDNNRTYKLYWNSEFDFYSNFDAKSEVKDKRFCLQLFVDDIRKPIFAQFLRAKDIGWSFMQHSVENIHK